MLAVLPGLAGCSDAEIDGALGDGADGDEIGAEEARRVVEQYVETLESGDYDRVRTLLHPDGPLDQELADAGEAAFEEKAERTTVEELHVRVLSVTEEQAAAEADLTTTSDDAESLEQGLKLYLRRSGDEWLLYDAGRSWNDVDYGDAGPGPQEAVRVTEEYYRALHEGDEERLEGLVHPDGAAAEALADGTPQDPAADADWTPEDLSFRLVDVVGVTATVHVQGLYEEGEGMTMAYVDRLGGEWLLRRTITLDPSSSGDCTLTRDESTDFVTFDGPC